MLTTTPTPETMATAASPIPAPAQRPRFTLYDATTELAAAYALLEESEGELTPEIEELLGHATGQWHEKAERVALFIRERESATVTLEAQAAALLAGVRHEVDRLTARAARERKMATNLAAYLKRLMEAAGVTKVEGRLISPTIQKNPPKLVGEVADVAALYRGAQWRGIVRVTPESYALDRGAALKLAKAGEPLPAGLSMVQETKLVLK